LAGPVRPGAGRDAGRVPPATTAGAVDNRAGPRPHPAARTPAVGRAAAAGPAGGGPAPPPRRHGGGRGRGLWGRGPRPGPPAGAGRRAAGRWPGAPAGPVEVRGRRGGLGTSAGRARGRGWARPVAAQPTAGSAARPPSGSAGGAVTRVAVAQLVLAPRAAGAGGVAADLAELP